MKEADKNREDTGGLPIEYKKAQGKQEEESDDYIGHGYSILKQKVCHRSRVSFNAQIAIYTSAKYV